MTQFFSHLARNSKREKCACLIKPSTIPWLLPKAFPAPSKDNPPLMLSLLHSETDKTKFLLPQVTLVPNLLAFKSALLRPLRSLLLFFRILILLYPNIVLT